MNVCDKTKSQFSNYMEKQLASDQISSFETHLANCADCRLAFQQVAFLSKRLRKMALVNPSANFDQALRTRIIDPRIPSEKHSLARNLILGTSSVAVFATLTFFAISTVNTPELPPSQQAIGRSAQKMVSQPVVHPQVTEPTLASESQKTDSLSKNPELADPNRIKLVDQQNRQP